MFRQKKTLLKLVGVSLLSSSTFISGMLLTHLSMVPPATAVQFPNGKVAFSNPPRLINTTVNFNGREVPGGKFYFTLTVPENAGEPLQAIKIKQSENTETIEFMVEKSSAFHGGWRSEGAAIPLASIGDSAPAPGEATVVFDQPVMPGSTVTIALQARRNPLYGGVYLFGVTAFPQGENSRGQFLGFGRLHFYAGS